MLIGIEAERANTSQKTGVEHYAKQLILHLAEIDKINFYVLYLRTKPETWLKNLPANFKVKVIPFPVFWTQIRISWEMLMHPVDVLLIPASALPIIHPKHSVSVIHDLAWDYFPGTYTSSQLYFLRFFTWYAIKFCSRIIAVSQSTKNDIIKKYKASPGKVFVVHHGYEKQILDIRYQIPELQLPDKFVLFLSTLQPRKNLEGLIEAFRLLKNRNPELPQKLVVVGKPGWKFESILESIEKNKDIVVYLNHVSDDDRLAIMSKADLLVLPSFYEGFGMQILEAFAAGIPVVTSNVSSMPEVAGDAAVYFDPKNKDDMAKVINMVLTDKSLAENLREKGRERLKDFSWEKCARETLEILTKN